MVLIENKSRLLIMLLALLAVCGIPVVANALPAFPGAEGWGSDTVGGRGGRVIFVTNTNDSGTGSLRAALTASGPRIIIFKTGGTLDPGAALTITNPYVTIAGQTAPGGGFQIRGQLNIQTHDVVLRGLRIRTDGQDALDPLTGAYNVIIDHNSLSWGSDTVTGTWYNPYNITYSWNIISEGTTAGEHSAGLLIGGYNDCTPAAHHITIHHNLLAHNIQRSPLIKHKIGSTELINNLIYNWGATGTTTFSEAYIARNHYIPGANTSSGATGIEVKSGGECPSLQPGTVMVSHNIGPGRLTDTGDDWTVVKGGTSSYRTNSPPFALSGVREDDVASVKTRVLASAGATAPARDPVDTRIVNDVNNRTGSAISSPSQVGGWPTLAAGTPPTDTDSDGMPDSWETAHGLNPSNSADANSDRDDDGYTNIEEYLNSLIPAVGSPAPPPPNALIPDPPAILAIQ